MARPSRWRACGGGSLAGKWVLLSESLCPGLCNLRPRAVKFNYEGFLIKLCRKEREAGGLRRAAEAATRAEQQGFTEHHSGAGSPIEARAQQAIRAECAYGKCSDANLTCDGVRQRVGPDQVPGWASSAAFRVQR